MKTAISLIFLLGWLNIAYPQQPTNTVKVSSPSFIQTSPSGENLVVVGNREIYLYNEVGSSLRKTISGKWSAITSFAMTDNGQMTVGDKSGDLYLFGENEVPVLLIGSLHKKGITHVGFINNGSKIVSVGNDDLLKITDVKTGEQLFSVQGHKKGIKSLAVSENYIVSGGVDGGIQVRNTTNFSLIKTFEAHDGYVMSLAISPDEKRFFSGGDDYKVKVWNLQTQQQESEFSDFKDWITSLEVSGNGEVLAVASLELTFYEISSGAMLHEISTLSDLVQSMSFLGGSEQFAVIERGFNRFRAWNISNLDLGGEILLVDENDRQPPQIYISNIPASDHINISKPLIELSGSVFDESGAQKLMVNGINVPLRENGRFLINLPLRMGENLVEMEAADINGNIAVRKFTVDRRDALGQKYDPSTAKNYLVAIGINDYEYWPKLSNAVNDASAVADVLLENYTFSPDETIMLFDKEATQTNIYNTLRELVKKVTPNDNILIYYAGHGYFDEILNEGYWVPVEAKKGDFGDYLPNSTLLKLVSNIDSHHTFLVADACFSGSLFSERKRGFIENVEQYKSRWAMASGRLEVVSDGKGGNSPFTSAFVNYLSRTNKDKFPVSELVQYVKINVAEISDQTPVGNPLASIGDEGGEFIFYKKK